MQFPLWNRNDLSCFSKIIDCVEKSPWAGKYDIVVGLQHTVDKNDITPPMGLSSGVGNETKEGEFQPMIASKVFLNLNYYPEKLIGVAIHEIGHQLGLYHIRAGCGEDFTCLGPNAKDCLEPNRREFIMDYCMPYSRFGPAAYSYLKNVALKDYLK